MNPIVYWIAGITLGAILLVLLLLFIFGKGDKVKAFIDFIVTRFKLLLAAFGLFSLKNLLPKSNEAKVKELEAENDRIKKELEKLRQELKDLDDRVKKEREAHEVNIKKFEAQILQKEKEREMLEKTLSQIRSQSTLQWFNNLPKDDQKKLVDEIRKDIKWEP